MYKLRQRKNVKPQRIVTNASKKENGVIILLLLENESVGVFEGSICSESLWQAWGKYTTSSVSRKVKKIPLT